MKGFYSPIERLAVESTQGKGTGEEFMTELSKKPGYKQAEVEDRDLQALMALPKMAREEFMAALKAKGAVVPRERILRGKLDPKDLTYEEEYERQNKGINSEVHHEDYTLPGGENYREILLQHPKGSFPGVEAHFGGAPNVLASIRVKDRTGPNGEKILHLEEIQSDWHQQGRKKGYATKEHEAQLAAARKQAEDAEFQHEQLKRDLDKSKEWSDTMSKRLESGHPDFAVGMPRRSETVENLQFHNEKIMDLMPQVMRADEIHRRAREEHSRLVKESSGNVPDAPFKKNWHELALKRMIQHAAEKGYDQIAITPGEEQAKRYGLIQYVDEIRVPMINADGTRSIRIEPKEGQDIRLMADAQGIVQGHGQNSNRFTGQHISSIVGKEMADKIMQANERGAIFAGDDLQVGGEGMKGFYDKMVPKFLNQFGKKYDAQVQRGALTVPDEVSMGAGAKAVMGDKAVPVHTFNITPEMREDVKKNGIPMYADGGVVSRETIKPVTHGIIKERVTVSPDLDAMQYELLSAKHFTKKVK